MTTARRFTQQLLRLSVWAGAAVLLACSVSVDSQGETQSLALIDRLPAGASAIAWIDFEALVDVLSQEEWDQYEDMFQDDEDSETLDRFVEATGFDPRTDLKQLAVAVMPGDAAADNTIIVVSVDIDVSRLEPFFADAETITYEGKTLYAIDDVIRSVAAAAGETEAELEMSTEDETTFVVVLDDDTLAMGTEGALRIAIDVDGDNRDTLKMDPRLNDLISDVVGHGQVWFAATKEAWNDQLGGLDQSPVPVPASAIENIETITMSMRLGEGLDIRLTGMAATAEDANLMATTLNGWTALGKMMLQQESPELVDILDRAISVGSNDQQITIEATLTDADIDVLQRLAEEQAGDAMIGQDAR